MSAALATLFFQLSKRANLIFSAIMIFLLGSAYAVWHYAVDGRAIGASVFFSVLVISYLLTLSDRKKLSGADVISLALLSSLVALVHGIAIFHIFPLAWWLTKKTKSPKFAMSYLLAVGSVLSVLYAAVFLFIAHGNSLLAFFHFVIGYASYEGTGKMMESHFWATNGGSALSLFWSGWARAICFVPPFRNGKFLADALALVILVLFVIGFCLALRKEEKIRNLAIALIGWGAIIAVFLFFWSPGQEGFRLHLLIPWTVAAAMGFAGQPFATGIFGAWAVLLFGLNFNFGLYPAAFIENNVGYQVLSTIDKQVQPGDVVLTANAIPGIEVLMPYFFPQMNGGTISGRLMAFRETNLAPLTTRLTEQLKEGHHVFLTDDLLDAQVQSEIEQSRQLEPGEMKHFVEKFKPVKFISLPNQHLLFRVELKTT